MSKHNHAAKALEEPKFRHQVVKNKRSRREMERKRNKHKGRSSERLDAVEFKRRKLELGE